MTRHHDSDPQRELNPDVDIASCAHPSATSDQESQCGGKGRCSEEPNIPIFTTLENCTDFSAALCRSSIEKILRPDSLI